MKTISEQILEVMKNHGEIHGGELQRMAFDVFGAQGSSIDRKLRDLRSKGLITSYKGKNKGLYWKIL